MFAAPFIKPTKDLVESVKTKTDGLPVIPAQIYENNFLAWPGLSSGIDITSHGTFWTLGSWTEIIAVNAITADFIILCVVLVCWPTANTKFLLELGEGGSGSESMIIQIPYASVYYSGAGIDHFSCINISPRKIIANTRISARAASSVGNRVTRVKLLTVEL